MAIHESNFNYLYKGPKVHGYIPEISDGPFGLDFDHEEATHRGDGGLTNYGEWWVETGFPDVVEEAANSIKQAEIKISEWQEENRRRSGIS